MDDQARELERLKKDLEQTIDRALTFLLIGRTGVGKSSTVNALLGETIAPVGEFMPTTAEVKEYKGIVGGIRFNIVDTPGLCDALPQERKDRRYLKKIAEVAPAVDCVWFVTRLDDTRLSGDEMRAIKLISNSFEKVWDRAIIVFTRAGSVSADKYALSLAERGRLIRNEIAQYIGEKAAQKIAIVAVENTAETTPDGKSWLAELFTQVVERISKNGMVPFMLALAKSVGPKRKKKTEKETRKALAAGADDDEPNVGSHAGKVQELQKYRIELDEEQIQRVRIKADGSVITGLTMAGGAFGMLFGGPAGSAIGAAAGAAIGIGIWLFGRRS